jgi:hypothetical protein
MLFWVTLGNLPVFRLFPEILEMWVMPRTLVSYGSQKSLIRIIMLSIGRAQTFILQVLFFTWINILCFPQKPVGPSLLQKLGRLLLNQTSWRLTRIDFILNFLSATPWPLFHSLDRVVNTSSRTKNLWLLQIRLVFSLSFYSRSSYVPAFWSEHKLLSFL